MKKDAVEMPPTQIERGLRELGIRWIAAHRSSYLQCRRKSPATTVVEIAAAISRRAVQEVSRIGFSPSDRLPQTQRVAHAEAQC